MQESTASSRSPVSLSEKPLARARRVQTAYLSLNAIQIEEGFNIRRDLGDIEGLAQSLLNREDRRLVEVLEPFAVRKITAGDETYYLLENGHRRYAALRHLEKQGIKIPPVPCQIVEGIAGDVERTYQQLLRNSGKAPTPIETALAVSKLIDHGEDEESVRVKMGWSRVYMADLRRMTSLPPIVQQLCAEKRMTSYLGMEFMRAFPDSEQLAAVLARADAAARASAEAKGNGNYRIQPKHSPELMATRSASKQTRKSNALAPTPVVATPAQVREALTRVASGGTSCVEPTVANRIELVMAALDAVEGRITLDALRRRIGLATA